MQYTVLVTPDVQCLQVTILKSLAQALACPSNRVGVESLFSGFLGAVVFVILNAGLGVVEGKRGLIHVYERALCS